MSYYVYILQSGTRRYTGVTRDLKNRLCEHNAGQNKSTKHKKGWKVVYFKKYETLSEARKEERNIKSRGPKILLHRGVAQPG